jgi:hypothetical protein
MSAKEKLCLIELEEGKENRINGNYELIVSGPVKHFLNHKYLVSQEQIDILDKKGIKYTVVKC